MRFLLIICCVAGLLIGCKIKSYLPWPHKKTVATTKARKPITTPATSSLGKISRLNKEGRFVIVTFPAGNVPKTDQRLNVYRNGLKMGELKVTGPQHEDNTVADITIGEAQVNDEVRED